MRIKPGVLLVGLQWPMRKALMTADEIWRAYNQELVITGGLDGEHSSGSLHYYGYAIDLRSRYFDANTKKMVVNSLRDRLGSDYNVITHKTHIHVEYQRVITETRII